MTDLIRHSAANLLAISLALAADTGDTHEAIATLADKPTAQADPSSASLDEATLKLA